MNTGLAHNIAQGQAQRDVGVDDRAEQQRSTTEIVCHGGPVPEVSGPPEATAPLARGGLPLQARRQRRLQPPSGTLSPPTVVISDSAFEEWLQSDNMEMPMFSQSEGTQQSPPTAVTLAATAPAAEAVTGTRVFPAASSKGVAEASASSAGTAPAAVPAAAPATGGTVFPTASGGGGQGARFCRCNSGTDDGPGDRRYCSLRYFSSGGTCILSCSSGIGGNIGGGTSDQRYCSLGRINPGGQSGRASRPLERRHRTRQQGRHRRPAVLLPLASGARAPRKFASAAGFAGEICGKRGASTHPFDPGTVFPLEVRHSSDERARHNSSSGGSSSSSSNDNTNDHDSW